MSAAQEGLNTLEDPQLPRWLGDPFWARLNSIEAAHQRIQSLHETERRNLEAVQRLRSPELHEAWRRYCDVIAELDRTTAELEALRTQAG
ncbi:MAG TPA: hypothetical protein VME21_04855 [Steroidobacteraceae bacterium]|nr:hypothetical protein [Steroidobacteraceae bacterium]